MAKEEVALKKTDSILQELNHLHEVISQRAYDLFSNHKDSLSDGVDDWLHAEREVIWRPAVELRQTNGQIEIKAAVAGMEPKDLDVQVTPEDILITGATEHHHDIKEGTVHLCEFEGGRLFRSIHLPDKIDPNSVKAEYRNGILRLTAAVAKQAPKGVEAQQA